MKESILNICMVAIASGIFKLAIPNSTFKKQICFLISCFLILSVLSTVKSGGISLDGLEDAMKTENGYVDFSKEAEMETKRTIANSIALNAKAILEENRIIFKDISVIIDISDKRSISIKQIRLVFSAENSAQIAVAENLIRREVGNEIEIVSEVFNKGE